MWSTGDYSYDGVGNISQIGTRAYTYDSFSRLEAVKVSGQTTAEQQATYDSYGNLVNLRKNGVARILTANVATNRPDGQIIQLASGKSNISVKKALIQQAMRP